MQKEIINITKLLLYKENPSLLEKIDFEDENTFLEPLLFAYFNSKKEKLFSIELLKEILQGYANNNALVVKVKESLNGNTIAYIPKLGYYNKEGKLVEPLLYADCLEVVKYLHPALKRYMFESYRGHTTDPDPNYKSAWQNGFPTLKKSLSIIKEHLPNYYKELSFANRKIYLHDNSKILNFASVETLGMLFFYVKPNATLMYFIEELIHQGAHNYLFYLTFNKQDFFKIDAPNTVMRDLTNQEWDYRNVYSAFHGVYTVYKRLECYDILIQKNVLSGKNKHELYGRLTDLFSRFRTGLELLDLDAVYTAKGKALYLELDTKCEAILNKYKHLAPHFDLSFRDLDFDYHNFINYNTYEKFKKLQESKLL